MMSLHMETLLYAGGVCGAVTAIVVLFKHFAPVFKIGERIRRNETRIQKLEDERKEIVASIREMREESRVADRLLIRAMVEIVDNRITGNNAEALKSTKKELMAFLQKN